MEAVSTFGTALKTTTAERSYPTLRGHPPTLTLGDELRIPDGLDRPETGVRIEVPPTLRHVYTVTPLAYYLAATVVPGSTPRLRTDTGYSYALTGTTDFETTVNRVLQHVFLLDYIVRTEGESPAPIAERQALESALDFDVERLYGQPLETQLETYLEVPFATTESQLPAWNLETRLDPTAAHVECLPFVANNLSAVTVCDDDSGSASSMETRVQSAAEPRCSCPESSSTYGNVSKPEADDDSSSSVSITRQVWRSDDGDEIWSTRLPGAFRNGLAQTPRDGPIEIELVCNDPEMSKELVTVHSAYRNRNDLPFDVTIHHDLTRGDLADVLTRESDFVHYIGHNDADGFRCSDGLLDASTIESVGAKAFFLNACQSYEQGLELINAGGIGGIVTRTDIENDTAVDAGLTIARLLNCGLPLYAVLAILQKIEDQQQRYQIIGNSMLTVAQAEQGAPVSGTVTRGAERNEITISGYSSSNIGQGGVFTPYIEPADSYHLLPGRMNSLSVTDAQLVEFFNTGEMPILLDGELRWSTAIKTSEL
ncbi:hypothetical protein GS429_14450 [Natronorubrum sp. JWXQ-INN-674]|uniref:CHAT domain-containing protein n=2 Tax=Natronorubrum halalkaliphilum TaxID=2691917 RepID=A0A6B0VQE2_9EURY|nr:hypothetical protein [Natronorubrum halalkaliphilum]